jgi:phage major head subunit gpT-like protein
MAVDVTSFSAMARAEFMNGKMAADDKPYPADYDQFTTTMPSTTKIETHTYMSNLPRLARFKGYSPGIRLVDKTYTIANYPWRIGPVNVRKDDLDDDQIGGYLKSINALPGRAQKDVGHQVMAHLAAGTSNLCFDGTAMFANSHTFGSGDNLDTANYASNDSATHKVIALITDNPGIKPVIFQDREALSGLQTDADTPQAAKLREYEYWSDCRFGLGYGFWWDSYHVTITDTPTVGECYELIRQIINGFRTFTLPKGKDSDDTLYVHEGWEPTKSTFHLCCNLKLAEILRTAISITQYVTSTGNVDNVYKDIATVHPTSALGA